MKEPQRPDISALLPDQVTVAAMRSAVAAELSRPTGRRRKRARRRPIILALGATLVLGGGVALAAGVFSADDVDLAAGVACYNKPRFQGDDIAVTGFPTSADPLAKCARLWREGIVDSNRGSTSPHLVACSEPGAGIAVFPGPDELCDRLDLEPLPADFAAAGREAGRAYTAWSRLLTDLQTVPAGSCPAPEALAARVRARLADSEYSDVSVVVSDAGPCAREVDPEGAAIAVLTGSRFEDRQRGLERLAVDAMFPLLDRTIDACIEPVKFEAMARATLLRAGLDEVGVHAGPKSRPCVGSSYGFRFRPPSLSFGTESLKLWEFNSRGQKKARRRWEREGWLPPERQSPGSDADAPSHALR